VKQRASASGLDALGAVGVAQTNDALSGAQALEDAVGEQLADEPGAGAADTRGLLDTPRSTTGRRSRAISRMGGSRSVESGSGAVAVGSACLLPPLSSGGARVAWP
jgi:hypothetical protein